MELVVDANILMSALISTEGATYDLMFNDRVKLFAPEFLFEELEKHKDEVRAKSGLSESDFEVFLSLITSKIEIISKDEFENFIPQAEEMTPDLKDTEYLALASKLKCSVWSNDKVLKNQDKVKVYSTAELLRSV